MSVTQASFIRFVYPFLFDSELFDGRVRCVEDVQCGSLGPFWGREDFPAQDVLRHVAQYLNSPEETPPTARLWKVTPSVLQSPQGLGAGGPGQGAEWSFVRRDQPMRFWIDDVQLSLFRAGVGFLTLRVKPDTAETDAWLDFLHFFRHLDRSGAVVRARRRVGIDEHGQPCYEEFFPEFASGREPPRTVGHLVEGLLRTADRPASAGPWWSEVFVPGQFLPYAVLLTRDVPADEQPRLLYKVHNFFHSGQGEHPAPEELRTDQEHLLPYAAGQWFVFSLDGAGFVGFDLPETEFFRTTLPDHLDDHYLLAFLLALHQRFALMGFSDEISRHGLSHSTADASVERERERIFRRIRDRFLQFTARGYFAQVMQRRHHHRCYRKWQEIFQIDQLFHELGHEIREMHDHLLMKRAEHIEQLAEDTKRFELRLSRFAAFFIPPALALAFLSAMGNNPFERTAIVTGISLLVAILLTALLQWRSRRGRT